MINIDKYAYSSKLKMINPMEKFIFSIVTLIVCLSVNNIVDSIIVIGVMGIITVFVGKTPLRLFLKLLTIPLTFLIIGILTITINYSINPDNFIISINIFGGFIGVSKLGIYKALVLFFKVLASVCCLYFLSLSTPMVDILAVLEKLKVPSIMIEMMSLIYRFIFILLETVDTMFIAQNSRLGYSNIKSSYKSLGALISSLFIRSFKRANDMYTSLESRGYDGELNVILDEYTNDKTIYIITILLNLLLLTIKVLM